MSAGGYVGTQPHDGPVMVRAVAKADELDVSHVGSVLQTWFSGFLEQFYRAKVFGLVN